jgi:hypothetical protein
LRLLQRAVRLQPHDDEEDVPLIFGGAAFQLNKAAHDIRVAGNQ